MAGKILNVPVGIFEKPFMVLIPNRSKGSNACAPYFFDTMTEAQKFLDSVPGKIPSYWWDKEEREVSL